MEWRGARTRVREEMSVNDMYDVFKGTVMEVAIEVVGKREKGEIFFFFFYRSGFIVAP